VPDGLVVGPPVDEPHQAFSVELATVVGGDRPGAVRLPTGELGVGHRPAVAPLGRRSAYCDVVDGPDREPPAAAEINAKRTVAVVGDTLTAKRVGENLARGSRRRAT